MHTSPQIVVVRISLVFTIVFVNLWIETFSTFAILFFIEDHAINFNKHKAESD